MTKSRLISTQEVAETRVTTVTYRKGFKSENVQHTDESLSRHVTVAQLVIDLVDDNLKQIRVHTFGHGITSLIRLGQIVTDQNAFTGGISLALK